MNFLTPKAPYLLYQALKLAKNGFTPIKTGILGLNWSFYGQNLPKNGYTPIKTSIFGLNWSFYGLWPIRFLIVLVKYVQKMAIHLLTLVILW